MGAGGPLTLTTGYKSVNNSALPMDHAGVSAETAPIPQLQDLWLDDTDKMWVPICLYCSNCTKFGQLILRKIIKIVTTRCQILRLKCTKFDFPRPRWGSLQRSPRPPSWIWGPTSNGKRGWKGRGLSLPKVNFLVTSLLSNGDIFNDYHRL